MKITTIFVLALSLIVLTPAIASAVTANAIFTPVATPKASMQCTILTSSFGKGAKDTSSNTQVTKLQKFLAAKGYFTASATGYFGAVTEASVKLYQKNTIAAGKTIPATGFVGSITRGAIQASSCGGALASAGVSGTTNVPPCPTGYTCEKK